MPISDTLSLMVEGRLLESEASLMRLIARAVTRPAVGDRPIDGNGRDTVLNRLARDAYRWDV